MQPTLHVLPTRRPARPEEARPVCKSLCDELVRPAAELRWLRAATGFQQYEHCGLEVVACLQLEIRLGCRRLADMIPRATLRVACLVQ